jgi:glycosyltransferase involved in cell wall biosynthesis
MNRAATLARNMAIIARLAGGLALEDPALLVRQVSRRVSHRAPRPISSLLTRLSEAVEVRGANTTTAIARARWNNGDLTGAIAVLDDGQLRGPRALAARALRRRLTSERSTMLPDFTLTLVPTSFKRDETGPTRVLEIATNSLPHTQSGYTVRTHRLARAFVDCGISVDIMTRYGYPAIVGLPFGQDRHVIDGVTYHRALELSVPEGLAARLQRQVEMAVKLAEETRPTVIHATTNYVNGLVAQAVAKSLGLPWIYEVRGLLEQTWASSKATAEARDAALASERYALLRAKETKLMLEADHVITLSEHMRWEIVDRGIHGDQVSVLPNAASLDALEAGKSGVKPREARIALGLPADGVWVGAVSSLVDYEGFDTLLHAVRILRESTQQDIRVLLVGDGVARQQLQHLAKELGLEAAVVFQGKVPSPQAVQWVQALDIVCLPRKDTPVTRSVTPLKPVEAMAARRPVVLSELPPLREMAQNGAAARLFKAENPRSLANEILQILNNSKETNRRVEAGVKIAARRTWTLNAESYLSICGKVESKNKDGQK